MNNRLGIDTSDEAMAGFGGIDQVQQYANQVGSLALKGEVPTVEERSLSLEEQAAAALKAGDMEAYSRTIQGIQDIAGAKRAPQKELTAAERRKQEAEASLAEMKVQAQQRELEAPQGEAPKQIKLPAAALDKVAGADAGIRLASKLENLFEEDWVGPAAGRAMQWSMQVPGLPVSDEYAQFSAETATLRNATIKAITGAQMSEPEAKRIMQQIPSFEDKPNVWRQKLASTVDNLRFMREQIIRRSGGDPTAPESEQPEAAQVADLGFDLAAELEGL